MILVVTRQGDAHGSHILDQLKARGREALSFDFSNFPSEISVSYCPDNGVLLELEGKSISSALKSVLYRRTATPKPDERLPSQVRDYIIKESTQLLDSLSKMTDCFWLSTPDAIKVASYKPHQLKQAQCIGFTIPPTLITNSPKQAEKFISNLKGDVAVKSLYNPGVQLYEDKEAMRSYALFTKRLSKAAALDSTGRVRNCPVVFQRYIDKKYELRVTVVENRVFACAIYSQDSSKTREDWRNYDLANTRHKAVTLPPALEKKCVELVKRMGLGFGCIDLIVTPDDEYVFLEINPNGQWLWVEEMTDLPISDAIVSALIR